MHVTKLIKNAIRFEPSTLEFRLVISSKGILNCVLGWDSDSKNLMNVSVKDWKYKIDTWKVFSLLNALPCIFLAKPTCCLAKSLAASPPAAPLPKGHMEVDSKPVFCLSSRLKSKTVAMTRRTSVRLSVGVVKYPTIRFLTRYLEIAYYIIYVHDQPL